MKRLTCRFLSIILVFVSPSLLAQEIVLQGKVRHANTHREISNVNIYVKNTSIGTSSDLSGSFLLKIPHSEENIIIIFEHISFHTLEVPLTKAKIQKIYDLQPKVIQLSPVSVEAKKEPADVLKDLPQPYSVIEAENFDIRGYVDAGDLLRTEQSIQIDEKLSGKKTLAIRGGNPDDVIVLFNGIKMNNIYDNVFDLSLINLDDVKQFEIIRGSNTTIYGAEAVSGVINIVPKTHRNYTIRFQQKFGTYASADWNLQLNRTFFEKLNLSYSYKQGGTTREYSSNIVDDYFLEKKNSFHTASIAYDLSKETETEIKNSIGLIYFRTDIDYQNNRFNERLDSFNQMVSLRYTGNIGILKHLNMVGSYQWLNDDQLLAIEQNQIDRRLNNRSINLNIEKRFWIKKLELLLAYQYEDSEMDYNNDRDISQQEAMGIKSAIFSRRKHGVVSIFKFHVPSESKFYKSTDFDISFRHDNIKNDYDNVVYLQQENQTEPGFNPNLGEKNWSESMLKLSSHLSGNSKHLVFNAYFNFGSNFKYPTMFQQISSPDTSNPNPTASKKRLTPEKSNNVEIGVDIIKETPEDPKFDGWQINANYFKNYYENKLRMFYLPGIPIAFYDNVQNVEISGFEFKGSLFLLKNKLTLELGSSIYSISEKAAFPFKSDMKHVFNILLDHAGYSLQFHFFKESKQVGWVRNLSGEFSEIPLPEATNFDIHLSKTFEIKKLKLFTNFSGRNLLDDDFKIEGIALRDRRFYVTFGVQY